ncbi:MAG: ParA family protein [Pseudonocardia sp.]|nr:ParA family protein [Pseudonocardia sp.]
MPAEIICMANFKGGVGKSTTAVNVAACLARAGHRTLLADCDPQANSSEMFIPEEKIEHDFRSIVVGKIPTEKVIQSTRIEGLDVLPASFDLAVLDKELVVSAGGVFRIRKALAPVTETYDFVVLDTGPNLSHLTLGALAAAQHIVITVSAAVWSTRGLQKFLRWIEEHQEEDLIEARLLGLVATMVTPKTRIGRKLLDDMEASPLPTFRTWIPRRIRAEDAALDSRVAGDPEMDMSLSLSYQDLTVEVADRVAELERGRHAAS